MLDYALGIDVSRWQGTMNWQTAVNAGASFAFIRVGSHDSSGPYTDWQFENNKNAGLLLPVGFYWYWRPQYSNMAQANHFHSLVKDVSLHLPPVVDVEDSGGLDAGYVANRLEDFVGVIASLFGRLPIIYTRQSFFDPYVASRLAWSTMDLWVARYSNFLTSPWSDGFFKFRDWTDWRFWQWSADGNFRGAEFGAESNHIDINYFNGDHADLWSYAGLMSEDKLMEERIANLEKLVVELQAKDAAHDKAITDAKRSITTLDGIIKAAVARIEKSERIPATVRALLLEILGLGE